ncbi:antibiotic biosynthesis monooxygenase [Desulfovibrio aminophilus]|nr:antibiotic biosynthesis monooxygenase [Desulfovibrio aminophilus]MCM0756642.1 antibiotic biosynthesis monooxygenase [Desulfovibrio aminophilus]
MIAREWSCRCPRDRRAGFLVHLDRTGVEEAQTIPGFLGHQVLERDEPGGLVITLVTYWESMDAVRAFAGDDPELARLYPGDEAFGIESETVVRHRRVLSARWPGGTILA